MGVVVNTKLIGHRQQQSVRFHNARVVVAATRTSGIGQQLTAAKYHPLVAAKEPDLILVLIPAPEVGAVAIVH